MRSLCIYLFLITVVALNLKREQPAPDRSVRRINTCSIFDSPILPQDGCWPILPISFLSEKPIRPVSSSRRASPSVLDDAFYALSVMQEEYFHSESGTWPTAIDWTAAVLQTHLSGLTSSLSGAFSDIDLAENATKSNIIDLYFSQTVASYFGQDHFSIRLQAYDDMLWVVLGWLEALKFIDTHSATHYRQEKVGAKAIPEINDALESQPWYGNYWVRSFAHRARIFWELASNGWGTDLCDGGMNWNPHEWVYKNAITNELWIAASIQMYLHFPGDDITTPWMTGARTSKPIKDPKFLKAAIEGYKWLMSSGMTNKNGLFVDGFHISGRNGSTKCDQRDEMVFTYNQGVLLTGQRGLWAVTGSPSYLDEGHALIQNVIRASGWSIKHGAPMDPLDHLAPGTLPRWRGLGRGGILEEVCDSSATCSQNGHTFKGIFFHHMTYFCSPLSSNELDVTETQRSSGFDEDMFDDIAAKHARACREYIPWLQHNAQAALQTRDKRGVFGTWWTAGLYDQSAGVHANVMLTTAMVDYRNHPIERVNEWGNGSMMVLPGVDKKKIASEDKKLETQPVNFGADQHVMDGGQVADIKAGKSFARGDLNDRGLGRTVETHNGGMAVLRAWWEISQI